MNVAQQFINPVEVPFERGPCENIRHSVPPNSFRTLQPGLHTRFQNTNTTPNHFTCLVGYNFCMRHFIIKFYLSTFFVNYKTRPNTGRPASRHGSAGPCWLVPASKHIRIILFTQSAANCITNARLNIK